MHNFKKVLFSIIGIFLVFTIVSTIVIAPYMNSECSYFQDKHLRSKLSGKINCIILGASHALAGIDPNILDKNLGCNSYNLSGSMMTLDNKYFLLSKELERNPVETVILEISHDTLSRKESAEFAIGDEPTIARLDSFSERIKYMVKYLPINDWLNLYSREFISGLYYYQLLLSNQSVNNVDYNSKGFKYKNPIDITLTKEIAKETYNSKKINTDYPESNVSKLDRIIDLCKSYNCRVVLVVVPESNGLIWQLDGWDAFYEWIRNYGTKNNCEVYDINLAKDRNTLFTDDQSFSDPDHLSSIGATTTTELLSQAMLSPESWEDYSYVSYSEMKKESQYADCL